eukprot:1145603-Pelagomonas_calceolata.AAC.1
MGAGSFLKGKPGGVITKRIDFKVDTGSPYVVFARGVIALNSLVFAKSIYAFVSLLTSAYRIRQFVRKHALRDSSEQEEDSLRPQAHG